MARAPVLVGTGRSGGRKGRGHAGE